MALIAVSSTLIFMTFGSLVYEVSRKLELLRTASSDNVQWTLSQAEVEFLEFDMAMVRALVSDPPDTDAVREAFDIFYSRMETINSSALYKDLRQDPSYENAFSNLLKYMRAAPAMIDAPDSALIASLPQLAAPLENLRLDVRRLSNGGLLQFARSADTQRKGVAETLLRLAVATALLLATLTLFTVFLGGLYRQSDRRRIEQKTTSDRLATILSTSLDAIVVADSSGLIIDFNGAAEKVFGYQRQSIIGKDIGAVLVPQKHRKAHYDGMARYRKTGVKHVVGSGRIQLEAIRANGEIFPIEMSIQSAQSADAEIFVAFMRDISHRVAAEAELVETRDKALAGEKAKAEFLAVMSHEIRTPLNGLLGNVTLLRDTPLSLKQVGYLDNMDISGNVLLSHVNDVLDIAKFEAGKMNAQKVPVHLNRFLQETVESQRGPAQISSNVLRWEWVGTPIIWCTTDPGRLRQVLLNLVGNAIKFTRNGLITIEVEVIDRSCVPPITEFRVIDTGIGIPEGDIERMFADFETRDSSYGRATGGTGLGLGIVRRIASVLDGQVGAESVEGEGSTFWVRLPLAECSAPIENSVRRNSGASVRSLQVLVVEDNAINRDVVRGMLTGDGHNVTEATDGQMGVHIADLRRFDLILMDISMPVMDGRAATRKIRESNGPSCNAPIVALTAHVMPEDITEFLSIGITDFLAKPLSRPDLRRIINDTRFEPADRHPQVLPKPVTANSRAPVLDLEVIASLTEAVGARNATSLMGRFCAEADDRVAWLSDGARGETSTAELTDAIHKLTGSAGTFGASQLKHHLAYLEKLGRQDARDTLDSALPQIRKIWLETRAELQKVAL
ncbi:ATP-binding protein [Pseudogemmobacter sp. W21_MBD1_M6]|uniref:ATP-binding protein n=1 Tax=Pseudogemmobacter sp. W21_MBD1_M6 TaxID=3240271 RepID=UPI003F9DDD75